MQALDDSPAIVVPTDFSRSSTLAMSLGSAVAKLLERRLLLVHVFTYVPRHHYAIPVDWMLHEILERSRKQLARARRRVERASVQADVLFVHDQGEPAPEILQLIGKLQNPILVLGTHSRQGIERFFIGSTAEQILRHAQCPVITVGPHVKPYWERKISKIILATDLTERSLGPLPIVTSLWSPGMRLVVLHVASPDSEIAQASWPDEIRSRMVAALGEAEVRNNVEFKLVAHANAAKAIRDAAASEKADLLAIGIHPAKTFTAYTSPKTGFQIVMSAPCAVLSVCQ